MLEADNTQKWGPREHLRILKNMLILSFASMVFFTGFSSAIDMQSSITNDVKLPMACLTAMFIAVMFSSLFLPAFIIKWLSSKWAIPFSYLGYFPYIMIQMWPSYYTMMPAGVLVGLSSAPLWCAMCTYISILSEAHSKVSKVSMDILLSRHFGAFYTIHHFNQVFGNLISSFVISTHDNVAALALSNTSVIPELCGVNFLPAKDAVRAYHSQPQHKVQILSGIQMALMTLAGIMIAIGLDSPKRYKSNSSQSKELSVSLLMATLKTAIKPNLILMITLSMFIGMIQGFIIVDFTTAFVCCAVGPGSVGYVLGAYGLTNAFNSIVVSYLVKKIGRVFIMICVMMLNSAILMTLMFWKVHSDSLYIMYIFSGLFGVCFSTWLVIINTFYAILFPGQEESAFASFRLSEAMGFIIQFGISPYIRISAKLYILQITMTLGSIGYFIVEYRHKKLNKTFDLTKVSKNDFDNKGFKNIE